MTHWLLADVSFELLQIPHMYLYCAHLNCYKYFVCTCIALVLCSKVVLVSCLCSAVLCCTTNLNSLVLYIYPLTLTYSLKKVADVSMFKLQTSVLSTHRLFNYRSIVSPLIPLSTYCLLHRGMGDLPPGVFRVCGKYRLHKKIGSGSFGVFQVVSLAIFILTNIL